MHIWPFRNFLGFPEWSAFSKAESDLIQCESSYVAHLKHAFGPAFLQAQAQPAIQQTAESLVRAYEDSDRELLPFRRDLSELALLHAAFVARRRELERLEAAERDAFKRSAACERRLVEVKKRSSNAAEVRQAQTDFENALAAERDCKRAFDRAHGDFQRGRARYERDVVQLLAVNLGAEGECRGRALQRAGGLGRRIADAAAEGAAAQPAADRDGEIARLRRKVAKHAAALEAEERIAADLARAAGE
jgi:hypothetical protein